MTPYLSIVVAARNDDYGGNFLERMQAFLDVLLSLASQHTLPAELIIVEWNPPIGRPRLRQALKWPKRLNAIDLHIVEVPETIHRRIPNADRIPLFDCLAKNVGIRRARGGFLLVTNPDILFSEELIAYFSHQRLSKDCFYRIDRYDFQGNPSGLGVPETLLYAKRNLCKVNVRAKNPRHLTIPIGRIRKWYGLSFGKWPSSARGYGNRASGETHVITLNDNNGVFGGVYTNASGDFLLASSESWRAIRGFPEFTDTFTHLDSYGCHQLKALGLQQMLLIPPCMIFHWEHGREEQKSRPAVPSEIWEDDLKKIRDGLLGPAINGEDWGLRDEKLPEATV